MASKWGLTVGELKKFLSEWELQDDEVIFTSGPDHSYRPLYYLGIVEAETDGHDYWEPSSDDTPMEGCEFESIIRIS